MTTRRRTLITFLLGFIAMAGLTGCEAGFIRDAARQSLSSFAVNVATTAVTSAIGP